MSRSAPVLHNNIGGLVKEELEVAGILVDLPHLIFLDNADHWKSKDRRSIPAPLEHPLRPVSFSSGSIEEERERNTPEREEPTPAKRLKLQDDKNPNPNPNKAPDMEEEKTLFPEEHPRIRLKIKCSHDGEEEEEKEKLAAKTLFTLKQQHEDHVRFAGGVLASLRSHDISHSSRASDDHRKKADINRAARTARRRPGWLQDYETG